MFVCSVCGYAFDPEVKRRKADEVEDDEEEAQDNMSEIIRCPQCNEINMYSRGSCWQCGLQFEIGEIA
jgi:rubredoxin